MLRDLRYSIRLLARTPVFTTVALLTMALGIGANATIFTVVNAVLLRPLPYADPDRLVAIWMTTAESPVGEIPSSLAGLRDWQEQTHTLDGIAAYIYNRYTLTGREGADWVRGAMVTSNLQSLLGAAPTIGRALGEIDEHSPSVVLSHRLWERRYHSDPKAIGNPLSLNGDVHTIVGVMPPSFRFPTPDVELWVSMASLHTGNKNANMAAGRLADWFHNRGLRGFRVVGRISKGSSFDAAHADLTAVQSNISLANPQTDAGVGVRLVPLKDQMVGRVQRALLLLLGAVTLVLLIACVNVAHLVLARATTRSRELAIRQSLGAGRSRLARQLLTEGVTLSAAGGALGVAVSFWATRLLVRVSPADLPRLEGVAVDARVLAFTAGLTLLTGIAFGLAPVINLRRDSLTPALREGTRSGGASPRSRRLQSALVAIEVALAFVLLVGAGLMIRSFERLLTADPGFRTDRVLTFAVPLPLARYPEAEQQSAFVHRMIDRIGALPGVERAGAASSLPPKVIQRGTGFTIDGQPPPEAGRTPTAIYITATPGYFEALGVRLRDGRLFSSADARTSPLVSIVNETLARRHFAGTTPVGRRIDVEGAPRTIVGVVADVKYQGLHVPAGAQIFVPFAQSPFPGGHVVVRSARDPLALWGAIRESVRSIDAEQMPRTPRLMTEAVSDSLAGQRFQTWLISLFGGVALALAAIGIHGIVAYGVAQRRHEIGVRLAIGAQRLSVLKLIVRQAMRPVIVGIVVGFAAALAFARTVSSLLFEVSERDPLTLAVIMLVLGSVALASCVLPASRAMGVDPVIALRSE